MRHRVERSAAYPWIGMAPDKRLSLGVVIPCHNNSWQLYGVLRSLDYQSVRPEMVVVADDNSEPAEASRIESLCRAFRARYRKVAPPRIGRDELGRRSHARNLGTACLDTDVILYLDGDMLLGPRYVEEVKRYHAVLNRAYIRGRRYSIPSAYQAQGMEACLSAIVGDQFRAATLSVGYATRPHDFTVKAVYQAAHRDRWEWCASNNLSVRRVYVSQIGYWDEEFLGWGEEDIDFSFRLWQLGLMPLMIETDDAASYHLEHPVDRETNLMTLRDNGRYLIGKFPGIEAYRREAYALYDISIDDFARGRSPR